MNNLESKPNPNQSADQQALPKDAERREMFRKLGKFAVYAAPFTVLAFTQKAEAAGSCRNFGACGGGGPKPQH